MKTGRFLSLFFLAALLGNFEARAEAEKFYVPPSQFSAAMQVMKMGFSHVMGLFGNGTASFLFDSEAKKVSGLKIAVEAGSLTTSHQANQRDLNLLLNPRTYREITFVAEGPFEFKDGKAEMKGKLTLHGTSKEAVFAATLNQVGTSKASGGMWRSEGKAIGLSLVGEIKRADFGMDDDSSDSAKGFGDTLKLMLEMQAIEP